MAKKKDKINEPSLDIWMVVKPFKIDMGHGVMLPLKLKEFVFLLNITGDFLVFSTEDSQQFILHKSILEFKKIKRVFP